ncbi:hypothetical protein STCU_10740 [Strigomonas culicis]|uniref:Uncharacterized protein n=1 Tax=Strigomonas culicis TaxID=28005 RepID=S9TLK1_9TRYP|nr:hypothetical protein STCU_10740 [Strigomonas culicis]|eukprot:EPY17238.1 hypothetical protein STCU_10740 [Strigomonas culicis]
MREKLTMLMKLRDDIRVRLLQSSKAKATRSPQADVAATAVRTPSPNRVVATSQYPLSPASGRKSNMKVFRASKKIRHTAKNSRK